MKSVGFVLLCASILYFCGSVPRAGDETANADVRQAPEPRADAPCICVYWRVSGAPRAPFGPALIVWPDGEVVFCEDSSIPGKNLRRGKIPLQAIEESITCLLANGIDTFSDPNEQTASSGIWAIRVVHPRAKASIKWWAWQDKIAGDWMAKDRSGLKYHLSMRAIRGALLTLRTVESKPVDEDERKLLSRASMHFTQGNRWDE